MLKEEIAKNTQVLTPVVIDRSKNLKEVQAADENK
jgi:hypothetical protein